MSDKILYTNCNRLVSQEAFTVDAIKDLPLTPVEFSPSLSRKIRIVVTALTTGTITPTVLESDTNADFSLATPVSLLQVYGYSGLNGQDAVDDATITEAKFLAGKTEYEIAFNPTKKYFGLRLTGTDTSVATLDVDYIYMPGYTPEK